MTRDEWYEMLTEVKSLSHSDLNDVALALGAFVPGCSETLASNQYSSLLMGWMDDMYARKGLLIQTGGPGTGYPYLRMTTSVSGLGMDATDYKPMPEGWTRNSRREDDSPLVDENGIDLTHTSTASALSRGWIGMIKPHEQIDESITKLVGTGDPKGLALEFFGWALSQDPAADHIEALAKEALRAA